MNPEIIKDIQIVFILSPFFLAVIITALTLKNIFNKMSKHSLYWLVGFIVINIALAYGLITGNISTYTIFVVLPAQILYWNNFLKLKKRNK